MSTSIEWTDETWNPTVGCSKVSPGCDNCYAISVAHRAMQPAHAGLTIVRDGERPDWTGQVRSLPDRLEIPSRWRKPRRVFVDSMSDLFHPDVADQFIARVWFTMAMTERHTYQVLTKRPQRMAAWVNSCTICEHGWRTHDGTNPEGAYDGSGMIVNRIPEVWPLPNVWLGTSIESDRYAFRADHLRATPAAVRFLSLEPLLGPLPSLDLEGIDWVIAGGESGPGARPMHPDWAREIRDRCSEASVPFLFKQWGHWVPGGDGATYGRWVHPQHAATHASSMPGGALMTQVGKKAAGRELDGRTWDQYPKAAS